MEGFPCGRRPARKDVSRPEADEVVDGAAATVMFIIWTIHPYYEHYRGTVRASFGRIIYNNLFLNEKYW
jgi:hypothetical protein